MDQPTVDFGGILETLPDPVAVCDENGVVSFMNREARTFLGVDESAAVRLDLGTRETVRQIRLTHRAITSAEFFLADIAVDGAPRKRASASFHPLGNGGYRVLFASGPDGRNMAPNVRMMESLVNVGRHLELFKSPDRALALFAASFADVFPAYAFHIDLGSLGRHGQSPWQSGQTSEPGTVDVRQQNVPPDELIFEGAGRAWRCPVGQIGYVQVEKAEATKFAVSERQAFETFAQQLGLSMPRIEPDAGMDAVGSIIDHIDAIVVVCDPRRRVLVSNSTFERIVGTDNVVGRDVLDFFEEPVEESRVRTSAAAVMAGGEAESFDAHLVSAEHGSVALQVQVAPARARDDDGATGFVLTGQQGERSLIELEARMTRAEQLMNLGQLATGVAHELKNPLTSILNYAEYLLAKYQDSFFEERDSQRLRRIIDGVERIDGFVHDLVTLARPSEASWGPTDVHGVIRSSAMMCEVTLQQSNAALRLELYDDPPRVHGNANQLEQVFVNLVSNAAKAMPDEGGNILVSTDVADGRLVCRVVDDALGMSSDTLQKIFEPFFTTRENRGGSGLGLALVQTIVQRHSGRVTVESTEGQGTIFTIFLPLMEA